MTVKFVEYIYLTVSWRYTWIYYVEIDGAVEISVAHVDDLGGKAVPREALRSPGTVIINTPNAICKFSVTELEILVCEGNNRFSICASALGGRSLLIYNALKKTRKIDKHYSRSKNKLFWK
jgi:hypothetical protein